MKSEGASKPGAGKSSTPAGPRAPETESCEVCGAAQLSWRSCKLICGNCRSIVMSCADL